MRPVAYTVGTIRELRPHVGASVVASVFANGEMQLECEPCSRIEAIALAFALAHASGVSVEGM